MTVQPFARRNLAWIQKSLINEDRIFQRASFIVFKFLWLAISTTFVHHGIFNFIRNNAIQKRVFVLLLAFVWDAHKNGVFTPSMKYWIHGLLTKPSLSEIFPFRSSQPPGHRFFVHNIYMSGYILCILNEVFVVC